MSNLPITIQMIVKRSLAHWRLLSALLIGVVLAVAVMASTVIYYDALRNLALSFSLSQHESEDVNLLISGERGPTTQQEYEKVDNFVERRISQTVHWFVRDRHHGVKSATFFLAFPGQEFSREESKDRAFFLFQDDLEKNIGIVEGRLPVDVVAEHGANPEVEVAIDARTADQFGLRVGDRLTTIPYWSDVNPQASVVVTGIMAPVDPGSEFWLLHDRAFLSPSSSFNFAPLFVSKRTFLEGVGNVFPKLTSTYVWLLAVDQGKLSGDNASLAKFHVETLEDELGSTLTSYRQETVLSTVLPDYERRLFFARVPIFIVMILIAAVVLYYVMALSSLLIEEHRNEVSLLRSRGASSFQILVVFVMEGLIIASLAVLIGPLIASGAISFLGVFPPFSTLSGGSVLSADLTKEAFYMSLVGGGLAFLTLLVPAIQASRIEIVQQKQHLSRPATAPFFQRYYLDILLLLIAILLFRQLAQQGSVLATEVFGEVVVDQFLLAFPAIVLLATAMILLRLFPLAMRGASHLLSSRLSVGLVLAIWQLSRNPTHYARLSLLLILTAGLGIFAASFGGTLERSHRERALYATGSDIRATGVVVGDSQLSASLAENVDGVSDTSLVYRGNGQVLSGFASHSYSILAMEPSSFPSIAWFREDFADRPVHDLIQSLPTLEPPQGIPLPEDSRELGVWVHPDKPQPDVVLQARLYDSNGRYFTYRLGELDFEGWRLLNAPLARQSRSGVAPAQPEAPLYLVSISIIQFEGQSELLSGSVNLDDLQIRLSDGQTRIIDGFDNINNWNVLKNTPQAATDSFKLSPEGGHDGTEAAVFLWSSGNPYLSRGVYLGAPLSPVPTIASDSFLKTTGHGVGEVVNVSVLGNRVPVELVSSVRYFPTLNPNRQLFLVADLQSLMSYVNISASFNDVQPNELWLSSDSQTIPNAEIIREIELQPFYYSQIIDREEEMEKFRLDPLVSAGWETLLFVAFAAVLLLSIVGYLIHTYISFRNRELEFALLRTMGLSLKQLMGLVWLEHAIIIFAGMALGAWMGGRLGTTIMPFLGNAEDGTKVLPPFVLEVDWLALGITYGVILFLFTCTIAAVIWFAQRIPLQRILRLGDM